MDSNNTYIKRFSFDKEFKDHFNDFDLAKRDLSKMRLKREIEDSEDNRRSHFQDMANSYNQPNAHNINYIYKPVYNLYQKEYQEKVDTYKNQLSEYNSLQNYLSDLLENGSLSETQLENTRKEHSDILNEMDKVRENIQSITNIDSSIK